MKGFKKALRVLVAAVMVCSMVPSVALAEVAGSGPGYAVD